jgi:hypothetical protein
MLLDRAHAPSAVSVGGVVDGSTVERSLPKTRRVQRRRADA